MQKKGYRTQASVPQEAKIVAAYIRVSTEDQAESGLGMDAQRTRCKAMCQVKGWDEPTFYLDDGISGTKIVAKRPGLLSLMEDIKAGKIHALIISSLDRLGRRSHIIINLVEEFRIYGVSLVSCKESFDTTTPHGQLMLGIFAVLAQFERDLVVQRTVDALTEKGKRDGEKGGRLPYGYKRLFETQGLKRVCVGVEIDASAAKIVRRVFALNKRGASLREIASDVSNGKIWRHTSIVEILRNKDVYKGGKRGISDIHWPVILK